MDALMVPNGGDACVSEALILVPVMSAVLMPGTVMPLTIGQPAVAASLQAAARTEQHVVIALQREPFADTPDLDDLYSVGTEARLLRYFTGRDGSHNAIMQGIARVRIEVIVGGAPHPTVTVQPIAEPEGHGAEIDARVHHVRERSLEILSLIEQAPPELSATIRSIDAAGALADYVTGLLDLSPQAEPVPPRLPHLGDESEESSSGQAILDQVEV